MDGNWFSHPEPNSATVMPAVAVPYEFTLTSGAAGFAELLNPQDCKVVPAWPRQDGATESADHAFAAMAKTIVVQMVNPVILRIYCLLLSDFDPR